MNYMVLIKLLYLADRSSLLETGTPITGDRMVAMPYGPVLSQTYDNINMGEPIMPGADTTWYEYVSEPAAGFEVSAKKEHPDTDELSAYELGVLESIYTQFGRMDKWSLVSYTHTLPEWSNPEGSSLVIEPDTILRNAGRSDAEIREITEAAEEAWFMQSLARIAGVGSR